MSTTISASDPSSDMVSDLLTVAEAAEVLRIGRTTAYELCRQYLATGGTVGIPVIRIGKQMRVSRTVLNEWMASPQ